MKSIWSKTIRWTLMSAVMFSCTTAVAIRPSTPGFHPGATPYPYQFGQPQLAPSWGQPDVATYDFGDTCCGPHWYDAFAEGVYFTRSGGGDRVLSTFDIPGFGPQNVALRSDDASSDWEPAIRVGVRWQLGAVTSVEATYLDALTFQGSATATTNSHNLYSFFSDFGNSPFGGIEEIDQATRHSVTHFSDFDNVNVHWRHDWTAPCYKANGAWLFGLRYAKLDERMGFNSVVLAHFDPIAGVARSASNFQYDIVTRNEFIGPQVGGEFVRCLTPGLLLSGKLRGSLLLNFAEQESLLQGSTLAGLNESADDDDLAFAADAGVRLIYQIHPLWKVRVGYELMYLTGVATAAGNINANSPFVGGPRPVDIEMDDDVLYHGGVIGIEFGW